VQKGNVLHFSSANLEDVGVFTNERDLFWSHHLGNDRQLS